MRDTTYRSMPMGDETLSAHIDTHTALSEDAHMLPAAPAKQAMARTTAGPRQAAKEATLIVVQAETAPPAEPVAYPLERTHVRCRARPSELANAVAQALTDAGVEYEFDAADWKFAAEAVSHHQRSAFLVFLYTASEADTLVLEFQRRSGAGIGALYRDVVHKLGAIVLDAPVAPRASTAHSDAAPVELPPLPDAPVVAPADAWAPVTSMLTCEYADVQLQACEMAAVLSQREETANSMLQADVARCLLHLCSSPDKDIARCALAAAANLAAAAARAASPEGREFQQCLVEHVPELAACRQTAKCAFLRRECNRLVEHMPEDTRVTLLKYCAAVTAAPATSACH